MACRLLMCATVLLSVCAVLNGIEWSEFRRRMSDLTNQKRLENAKRAPEPPTSREELKKWTSNLKYHRLLDKSKRAPQSPTLREEKIFHDLSPTKRDQEDKKKVSNKKDSPFDDACYGGREVDCKYGTVNSPGYPDSYRPLLNCSWHLVAPKGQIIEVDFIDVDLDGDCSGDSLTVSDRGSAVDQDPALTLCGDQRPKFESVGNEVTVSLFSDGSGEGKGFLFNFIVRDPVPCEDIIEITQAEGSLDSPLFPDKYSPNSHCLWRIVTPEGTRVSLEFTTLSVERSRSCEYDSVTLYDGGTTDDTVLGKYCGFSAEDLIEASANIVLVSLKSDESTEERGFNLEWHSIEI